MHSQYYSKCCLGVMRCSGQKDCDNRLALVLARLPHLTPWYLPHLCRCPLPPSPPAKVSAPCIALMSTCSSDPSAARPTASTTTPSSFSNSPSFALVGHATTQSTRVACSPSNTAAAGPGSRGGSSSGGRVAEPPQGPGSHPAARGASSQLAQGLGVLTTLLDELAAGLVGAVRAGEQRASAAAKRLSSAMLMAGGAGVGDDKVGNRGERGNCTF